MGKKLLGKVAIVTGASKGIGASIALELSKEGASVVVNYSSSKSGAENIVKEIVSQGGRAIAVQADMSKKADIQNLFSKAKNDFGKIDILVNNAGIYEVAMLEDITSEHFHKMFDLNVLGLLLASHEAVKHFGTSGGSIINISSLASRSPTPSMSVYCATKAAVDSITKSLAKELGLKKIRVNSINPGLVETEGVRSAGFNEGEFREDYEQKAALGRIGQPKDIAPAVVFLSSDDASWITGETFYITGGF